MATLIEAVKRQALSTFAKNRSGVCFEESLNKLRLLASKLTSSDVELDKSLLFYRDVSNSNPRSSCYQKSLLAPVTYIEIFENPDITIGIFILRNGARLPLHDHPLMYGILKVIHGKVRIHSYSPLSRKDLTDEQVSETLFVDKCGKDYISSHDSDISPMELFRQVCLFAVKEPEVIVDETDDACVLSPRRGNLHEIHPVDGPAAFVDILSPPYDANIPGFGPRPCRYFKEVSHSDEDLVTKLIRIPSPSDYWSDTAPYTGPSCNSDE